MKNTNASRILRTIIVSLFIFCFCTQSSVAKTIIDVYVKGDEQVKIGFHAPINGYFNYLFKEVGQSELVSGNQRQIVLNDSMLTDGAFVSVIISDDVNEFMTRADLLLFKGDEVQLVFDCSKADGQELEVSGSNARGNQYFNRVSYYPFWLFEPLALAMTDRQKSIYQLKETADSLIERYARSVDSLYSDGAVSLAFKEMIDVTFSQVVYRIFIERALRYNTMVYGSTMAQRMQMVNACFQAVDRKLRGRSGAALYQAPFYLNLKLVYQCISAGRMNSMADLERAANSLPAGYWVGNIPDLSLYALSEPSALRDDLWTLLMESLIYNMPHALGAIHIDFYMKAVSKDDLKQQVSRLLPQMKEPVSLSVGLEGDIVFLDSTGYSADFSELAARIEGGDFIMLDIWATWCAPCIASFKHLPGLDSLFKAYKVKRLFVSRDNMENRATWQKAVEKYRLAGYHVIAGRQLDAYIDQKIYPADNQKAIPRYVLLDKSGHVLVADVGSLANRQKIETMLRSFQ